MPRYSMCQARNSIGVKLFRCRADKWCREIFKCRVTNKCQTSFKSRVTNRCQASIGAKQDKISMCFEHQQSVSAKYHIINIRVCTLTN